MKNKIFYRTVIINELNIFYREAGKRERPVLLLLHGFPSSSHMFRNLITELSDSFYIIAPDYPGFGQSSAPAIIEFNYTFDNLSQIIEKFIEQLQLSNITLYMQDYGGPVGMRIAARQPALFRALIIQNANAYTAGLGSLLQPLTAYAQNPDTENEKAVRFFLSLDATKWQYLHGAADPDAIDPDSYITDQYYLDRPGNDEIQLALFRDYGNNYPKYGEWQQYFRSSAPDTLVIWGKNDAMFIAAGADAYKKDLPNAEVIYLDGGHCLLEEHYHQVAAIIKDFIHNRLSPQTT
ncbi:MAG: alpha/beta hydrolase [Chitinophagaceae bacterium]|nr:alpha/beta hydrolase [Chitinophagaceae bacterium]